MDSFYRIVREALEDHGFVHNQVGEKERLFGECRAALDALGADAHRRAFFVPGRIEVLGKHTDYCGGRSVVAAVDQGIAVVAAPRKDSEVRFVDAALSEEIRFPLSPDIAPVVGKWSNYPMTTARRIARDFATARRGADVAFASDLVPAAGMSSSSALIIASFFAIGSVNGLDATAEYAAELATKPELACYLAAVEGGKGYGSFRQDHGVGTAGGSEDHTAILCSEPGRLGVYSYRPVRAERAVDFPEDRAFVIASSGVVAEKTGSAMALYNRASRLASAACETASRALGSQAEDLATLVRRVGPAAVGQALAASKHGEFTPEDLACRFEHFVAESEIIIPKAVDALAAGDLDEWGRQVDLSQIRGIELLRNQVSETVSLAASARECGADAASAFGAGYGGSVWAMVAASCAGEFTERWKSAYVAAFPGYVASSAFFLTRPGPAAFEIPLR